MAQNSSQGSASNPIAPGYFDFGVGWFAAIPILAVLLVFVIYGLRRNEFVAPIWRECSDGAIALWHQAGGWLFLVLCGFYVIAWRFSQPLRKGLKTTTLFLLVVPSLIFVMEALGFSAFHSLVEAIAPAGWARAIVIGLGAWAVIHRVQEIRRAAERPVFATAMHFLFRELAALRFSSDQAARDKTLEQFVTMVLSAFFAVFKNTKTSLNLMMPDESDNLRVKYVYPVDRAYDDGLALPPGVGAAGFAYLHAVAVYVPAVRFRHGVRVEFAPARTSRERERAAALGSPDRLVDPVAQGSSSTSPVVKPDEDMRPDYKLCKNVYHPSTIEPYKSVLSVPVVGSSKTLAILNFDSPLRAPYDDIHLSFGHVAAAALAMLIDRYNTHHGH